MAKCRLDIDDPKFVVLGNAADTELKAGLQELQQKVLDDHRLSGFFSHPMPGFPQFQNKIWKWEFAPSGDRSSTRKGWRLLAYVENPDAAEPVSARAFVCYDKAQQPKGNPATFVAERLKEYLSEVRRIEATPDRFRRQDLADGGVVSICYECFETIHCADHADADVLEAGHDCPVK